MLQCPMSTNVHMSMSTNVLMIVPHHEHKRAQGVPILSSVLSVILNTY
jgi:hypothetical protein